MTLLISCVLEHKSLVCHVVIPRSDLGNVISRQFTNFCLKVKSQEMLSLLSNTKFQLEDVGLTACFLALVIMATKMCCILN